MPTSRPCTAPGPTASIMPTPSCPGMNGSVGLTGHSPRAAWMSVWQRPEASMRTSTCSGPGSGVGTSSMTSGRVKSWTTAALMGPPCSWWTVRSQRRLGGRDPRDGNAEGRAGHVVQPGAVEEPDGVGVAPVLAADAELEARSGGAAALGGLDDQGAHALLVDRLERRPLDELLLEVGGHDPSFDVVAGQADGGLRQVVGAEGEEVRRGRQLAGDDAGPRQLDHRPDEEVVRVAQALLGGPVEDPGAHGGELTLV